MRLPALAGTLTTCGLPVTAWAQQQSWEPHPVGWLFALVGLGLLLLVLSGWVLLNVMPLVLGVIAAVLGIRWLVRVTERPRSDAALAILRERYARGEITKDEFDAKMRDLGDSP